MNKILILYPKEFSCQSKFDRKLDKILSKMNDFDIVFNIDHNHLIEKYFSGSFKLSQAKNWRDQGVTHAIIFDDGEVFPSEIDELRILNVLLRIVAVKITRVVNIKKEVKYAVLKSTSDYEYVGRGSYWGNPYSMFSEGESREEVIRKFKYDFDYEKFPNKEKKEVYKLAGKRLGCFCKPDACHGDVLADFLNQWDDGL